MHRSDNTFYNIATVGKFFVFTSQKFTIVCKPERIIIDVHSLKFTHQVIIPSPIEGPVAVAQGVTAAIVGDGAAVHRRQQVLPVAGAVGIALDNARAVRDRENIARSVVGVGLSGAVTLGHGQEIPGGVVGADGGTLDARAAAGYIPSKCTRQIALSTH